MSGGEIYTVPGDCAGDKEDDRSGACKDDDWGGERGDCSIVLVGEDDFDGDGSEVGVGEIPIPAKLLLSEDVSPSCRARSRSNSPTGLPWKIRYGVEPSGISSVRRRRPEGVRGTSALWRAPPELRPFARSQRAMVTVATCWA